MMTLIDPLVNLYRTETKYDYPIANSKCGYDGIGSVSVSKHYITKFSFPIDNNGLNYSLDVAIISAHLLAKPTDPERCSKREAQAQVLLCTYPGKENHWVVQAGGYIFDPARGVMRNRDYQETFQPNVLAAFSKT